MKKAKWIGLALMCVSLVLTVIMGYVVFDRVMGFLRPAAPNKDASLQAPSSSSLPSVPPTSSAPEVPPVTEPTTTPASIHQCEFTIKGKSYKPTCDAMGYTVYTCICGKEDYQDYIDSLGHIYSENTVVPPTCTKDGWTERSCSRCKIVERSDFTPAAHTFTPWTAVADTGRESRDCSVCGVAELRGTASGTTWKMQITNLGEAGGYTQLHIEMLAPKAVKGRDHYIYVGLADPQLTFSFSGSYVILSYTVNGEQTDYALLKSFEELTISPDGTAALGKPT